MEAVADYLESEGVGTIATNLFINKMPNTPVDSIAVNGTGGSQSIPSGLERPTFQILIRRKDPAEGAATAKEIYDLLHDGWGILGKGWNGRVLATNYHGIYYRDENNHVVYTLNFVLVKVPDGR